jgi:transposase
MVMANLSVHKGERVRELIEERGWELMYLPPYSPSLNPIAQAFSRSRGSYEKPRPAPARRWWRRWVGRSRRSHPETRRFTSWSTMTTA